MFQEKNKDIGKRVCFPCLSLARFLVSPSFSTFENEKRRICFPVHMMYSRLTHADMLCVYRQLDRGWLPPHQSARSARLDMPICYVLPMRTCCACTLSLHMYQRHLGGFIGGIETRSSHLVTSNPADYIAVRPLSWAILSRNKH